MTNEHEMMVEEIVSELEVKMNRLTPAGGFMLENGGYSTIFLKDWLRTTLTTLITKVREEEIERMLQYSHIGYEFIEGVRQYANERGITNTNK